jgi:SpoVK/Ycf46/Vps4 family AAA+-type ATPase
MDDLLDQGKKSGFANDQFWTEKKGKRMSDEEDEDAKSIPLPVHPIVRVFSLGTHDYVECHIGNVEEYRYDASIIQKLVLPDEHKELIDLLTGSAIKRMDDIIRGKAVGVIILCSGKPGTGKTLTAEVYSEAAKRPLYMVQCSQLGTNEEELEKHLSEVLDRATRWKAILLIDEADVYIHERGADIGQNAIVGVFLRLLEYYKGILFLTTNRETVVDDAVISRVTAHVHYDVPTDDDTRKRLWKVLCQQYGVDPTASFLSEAIREFPRVSGRDIRQIIRLARIMADHEKKPVSMAMLKRVSKFHDFMEED